MNKNTNKKPVLKKQHYEILFEDMQDKFNVIIEAVSSFNTKIDTKTDALADEIRKNREETIFLIKASIESSEQRLTKKIEDGDRFVIEHLTKKIEDGDRFVIEHLTKKIDGDIRSATEHTDQRIDGINHKLDVINDNLKAFSDTLVDHEQRIYSLEHIKKIQD